MNDELREQVEFALNNNIDVTAHMKDILGSDHAAKEAEQLKLEGLEKAASKYGPDLLRAQMVAELLGMNGSIVTSDDVRVEFLNHYDKPLRIGNAIGNLFRDGQWQYVGREKSKRKEAHGRYISCWLLRSKL